MAKSKAQKQRAHLVRNGRRDPELNRNAHDGISTHVRTTPTLAERTSRRENKHKNRQHEFC